MRAAVVWSLAGLRNEMAFIRSLHAACASKLRALVAARPAKRGPRGRGDSAAVDRLVHT